MNLLKSTIFIVLFGVIFKPCVSQTFNFKEPISFNEGIPNQDGNWTLDGDIVLTPEDLIVFDPKVYFQTCHDVCAVDLTTCKPDQIAINDKSCFCKEKRGDNYRIHISSTMKASQSGATLKANVPSRTIFGTISGTSVVGTFPTLAEVKTNYQARYRVDEGESQKLLPSQNISVCPNQYVGVNVCVPEKNPEDVLTIGLQGEKVTSSSNMCVMLVHKYNFDKVPVDKLSFSIVESEYKTRLAVSKFYIEENKLCNSQTEILTTTPTSVQDSSTQVADVISVLTGLVNSMKHDFDKSLATINGKMSQFASLELGHKELKSMLKSAIGGINGGSTQLSAMQGEHEKLKDLVHSLNSSIVGYLDEAFEHLVDGLDSMHQDMDSEINLCSKGFDCEAKPKPSRMFRCFRVEKTPASWYEAVQKCQDIGGFLVEIHDRHTLDYVKRIVSRSFSRDANIWIGATNDVVGREWRWDASGKKLSITDWNSGEPNNFEGKEHCVQMAMKEGNRWNDSICKLKYGYVCEKKGSDRDCGDWD